MSEPEKIALEKKKHIVEVYPSEVDGYLKNGWKRIAESKDESTKESK